MANLTNTTTILSDEYNTFDGAKYDVLSIICTVLSIISFISGCIFFGYYLHFQDKESGKWPKSKTHDTIMRLMNLSAAIFFMLMIIEAINLKMRYDNDECDYDPNQTCKGTGRFDKGNVTSCGTLIQDPIHATRRATYS